MDQDERYYILQERVSLQTYLESLNPERFRQLQQKTKDERAAKTKASVDNINQVLVKIRPNLHSKEKWHGPLCNDCRRISKSVRYEGASSVDDT